ncbi:MAG: hypothetical protein MJZ69_01580 [Bacteroidaceae bacterium]|nr:hypothetical protein [Bacteroidaceae bacterium]
MNLIKSLGESVVQFIKLKIMEMFKLLKFLFKAIFNKKSKYTLQFIKVDGKWYANIEDWPAKYHKNTQMVFGANRLLDVFNTKGYDSIWANIYPNSDTVLGSVFLTKIKSKLFRGAFYQATYIKGNEIIDFPEEIWICPVTLFVLGRYPKRLTLQLWSCY